MTCASHRRPRPALALAAVAVRSRRATGRAGARASTSCTRSSRARRPARPTFRQVVARKGRSAPQESAGTFTFQRPGKFRWALREALRAADRRRRRQAVDLRPRPQPGDRAQARRRARREPGGAARRRQRAREATSRSPTAARADGLEWVDATPEGAGHRASSACASAFADNLPRRWSSPTPSAT